MREHTYYSSLIPNHILQHSPIENMDNAFQINTQIQNLLNGKNDGTVVILRWESLLTYSYQQQIKKIRAIIKYICMTISLLVESSTFVLRGRFADKYL